MSPASIRPSRSAVQTTILLAAALLLYLCMLLLTLPHLLRLSDGSPIPDLMPGGYTARQLHELFERLGEQGRAFYLGVQLPLDTAFPSLLAIACARADLGLLHRLGVRPAPRRALLALPITAGLLDCLENLCIAAALLRHPAPPGALAAVGSTATVLKSPLVSCSLALLLVLALLTALRCARSRRETRVSDEAR